MGNPHNYNKYIEYTISSEEYKLINSFLTPNTNKYVSKTVARLDKTDKIDGKYKNYMKAELQNEALMAIKKMIAYGEALNIIESADKDCKGLYYLYLNELHVYSILEFTAAISLDAKNSLDEYIDKYEKNQHKSSYDFNVVENKLNQEKCLHIIKKCNKIEDIFTEKFKLSDNKMIDEDIKYRSVDSVIRVSTARKD